VSTVSDGVGVGVGVGCAVVALGDPAGLGDALLLAESATAGGGGVGAGDAAGLAVDESGRAVTDVSPALGFEPARAEPNATTVVSAAESRRTVI
jgi:hypothetical protein